MSSERGRVERISNRLQMLPSRGMRLLVSFGKAALSLAWRPRRGSAESHVLQPWSENLKMLALSDKDILCHNVQLNFGLKKVFARQKQQAMHKMLDHIHRGKRPILAGYLKVQPRLRPGT